MLTNGWTELDYICNGALLIFTCTFLLVWAIARVSGNRSRQEEDSSNSTSHNAPSMGPSTDEDGYNASFFTGDIDAQEYWRERLSRK